MHQAAVVAAVLLLLAAAAPVRAISLWGMEGLGRPVSAYDMGARGAGSTAIGVVDPFGMSSINPAGIAWAPRIQACFGFVQQDLWAKAKGSAGTSRLGSLDVTGGSIVLPLPARLCLGLGYRPLLDGNYQMVGVFNRDRDDRYERTLHGTGGVGELAGTLTARDPSDRLAVGLTAGWREGTLRDQLNDVYQNSAAINTSYLLRTRLQNGRSWGLGLQAKPVRGISLGAFYHGKTQFDVHELWTSTSKMTWENDCRVETPDGAGAGVSGTIRGRYRLALDWAEERWNAVGGTLATLSSGSVLKTGGFSALAGTPLVRSGPLTNSQHLGIGATFLPGEVSPKDPILTRALWRAGFSYDRLPVLQKDGSAVHEWALSAGIGLPVAVDRGYLNGVLEIGKTGDLGKVGLSEFFVRLGVGATFGKLPSEY
jgi:hypothetical protein